MPIPIGLEGDLDDSPAIRCRGGDFVIPQVQHFVDEAQLIKFYRLQAREERIQAQLERGPQQPETERYTDRGMNGTEK